MSEPDFESVMVALNDGLFGNKVLLNTIGYLTTGVFNYIRSANSPAYSLQSILGVAYDYIYRPLSDSEKQEQVNQKLLAFMAVSPGANGRLSSNGRL